MNIKVCKAKNVRLTHRLAMLTLFLYVFSGAKGQQNFNQDGLYYIAGPGYSSSSTTSNFYLCPTENWNYYQESSPYFTSTENGMPFMTTYNCRDGVYNSDKSVWYIKKKAGTDYYYIIRVYDGKKLTFNRGMLNSNGTSNNVNQGRMRLHLEASPADDDDALFEIIYVSSKSSYDIKTKKAGADDANRKFVNVTQGNQSSLQATDAKHDGPDGMNVGGIIGLWTAGSSSDNNSKWYFQQPDTQPDGNAAALCKAPTIANSAPGVYTITPPFTLPTGYTMRYTFESITPNPTNGEEYTGQINIDQSQSGSHLRAWVVAEFSNQSIIVTKIADEIVYASTPNPSFEVLCENELQITCPASGAVIYYTINDPNPSSSNGTLYVAPFTDGLSDGDDVYAIAYSGGDASDVEQYHYLTNNQPPTLSFNPSNSTQVIVDFLPGQTIHYTVNGGHPDPNDEGVTTPRPFTISNQFETSDVLVIAIATSNDGRGPSCPVTEIRRPKKPTITTNDVCNGNGELIQTMELTGITDQDIGAGKTYWYALSNGEGQTAPALNTFTQYTRNSVLNIMDIAAAYSWDGSVEVTLHAYAKDAGGNPSVMVNKNYTLKHTAAPSISYVVGESQIGESQTTVTITAVEDAIIHYSIDGVDQTPEQTSVTHTFSNGPSGSSHTFIASAKYQNEGESCEVTKIVRMPKSISSLDDIENPNGVYDLTVNFDVPSTFTSISFPEGFKGSLNGNNHTISNLRVPLFNVIDGGTVNNLFFDNVHITAGNDNGNVGVVCSEATGASRIYNCGVLATNSTVTTDEDGYTKITDCSSTISGSGFVGGIVGLLDGSSRVINCFSYANITGGTEVGGIVGHNSVATTSTNRQTMVMNCMFYGDITGGDSKALIYNGKIISNKKDNNVVGVSNFNYFWSGASYVQNKQIDVYNCALAAETRFLQRFEFFRHLLNSNRALAAWWATGSRDNKDEMLKWVMEPSQIGTSTPYPILKTPGKYPSVVNFTPSETPIDANNEHRNEGRKLGTLTVHIEMGSGAVFGPPTGAEISMADSNHDTILIVTDKDPARFNFNYGKVQLPYYNDVGTKNYTGYRVVTGWKIVNITGGNPGSFTTGDDAPAYNFADRNCTNKDLYGTNGSNRVFSQGAYWDVPEGVTAITIQPYWAKAAYLADAYADVVYNTDMSSPQNVSNVGGGQIYSNGNYYSIAGDIQVVYTKRDDAISSTGDGMALFQGVDATNHTVYDYALVLVGNYHLYGNPNADSNKPYTLTSIDLDGDNEPDYSYIWRFDGRKGVHPVRVDFINISGLGMAQKSTGSSGTYNFGILQPKRWFESTNTSLFYFTQFEYDAVRDNVTNPVIVQGGVMDQWVGGQTEHKNNIAYFHVGGNVWFKEFHRGTHQDKTWKTKHPPVSVTGGDYDEFYLTGLYRGDITNYNDNAECYINGGRFGIVCGAAQEGIGKADGADNTGNITWQIQNADICEFYAGGLNAAVGHTVTGNLSTTITGGYIGVYCGGPKFGDMSSNKTITTTATDCTFGTFFGAGYGGNAYSRQAPRNHNHIINFPHNDNEGAGNHQSWNDWVDDFYRQEYDSDYGGVSTQFNYQFLPMSSNVDNVARLFVEYVKFSLATTHSVTSSLTDCTILNNFYGGGNLGKVDGQVSSVLESCTAKGNVYGAGQASTLPTVEVDSIGFRENQDPWYYEDLGSYRIGVKGQTTTYTWENGSSIGVNNDTHILYTTVDLDKRELGSVKGNVTLTVKGNSTVFGSVFGGGEESMVVRPENTEEGNTEVKILGKTKVLGNIYGGGNMGEVEGNTKVIVNDNDGNSGGDSGGGGGS